MSKAQIDRLGESLRAGPSPEAITELDRYRQSFRNSFETVTQALAEISGLQISGRPAKSTFAIVEKLKRESIRLSQVQDIAGCRIIVDDRTQQDEVVRKIADRFPDAKVIDRRSAPSSGYRAVHIIVQHESLPVEIQVRTALQHSWAELSEKLADRLGIELKYGGGPERAAQIMNSISSSISMVEFEKQWSGRRKGQAGWLDWAESQLHESIEKIRVYVEENHDLPD